MGFTLKPEDKCRTPINKSINEEGTSRRLTPAEKHTFLCALGMTGWLNQTARPDIALAQSRIAQHCADPSEDAMDAIIHLYSYLWHNRDLCLRTCLKGKSPEMEVLQRHMENPTGCGWSWHCDTDHAGNREIQNKRRSQNSRYSCNNGMAVDWRSTVTTYGTACKELPEAHADCAL